MPLLEPAIVDIAVIGITVTAINITMQHLFFHRKQLLERQDEMKLKQKKLMELLKKEDEKSKREAKQVQEEMMESTMKMMDPSIMLRQMVVSLIVFAPVLWYFHAQYDGIPIQMPFPFPWWDNGFVLLTNTSWLGWYFLIVLVFSLVLMPVERKIFK